MDKKMFLVKFLTKHLTHEILRYVYVLIGLEISTTTTSTITFSTTTTSTTASTAIANTYTKRFFSSHKHRFNLRYKLLDKMIFFNQQYYPHHQHYHYQLMITLFCQSPKIFSPELKKKAKTKSVARQQRPLFQEIS